MERSVYQRLDALEGEHWWFGARREILKTLLCNLNLPSKRPRILEAGVGTGGNLDMLAEIGSVRGFEFDEEALTVARGKTDGELEQGTLPHALPEYPEQFDLVVAFDVIEHVEKDQESLAALRQKLSDDGKFVMTVPAFPFLWSAHDETHHHFRRYTRPVLERKLREAGFDVDYISYYNSILFPVIAGVRMVKKLFGMKDSADDSATPLGLNGALQAVFSLERHWVGKISVPFGVSLVAVAQKSK